MRIKTLDQLRETFQKLAAQDPDLVWLWEETHAPDRDRVLLDIDGIKLDFAVAFGLHPGEQELKALGEGGPQPLLVVPCLNTRLLQRCKDLKISVTDLNGQAWIRAKGVLIDRPPLPGRNYRYDLEPRNVFVGKSERIVRCLLTDRNREWTQAELCLRTRATSGLVSRIINHLLKQEYLIKTGSRTFKLEPSLHLLDDWAKADRLEGRTRLIRYSGLSLDTVQLEEKLESWAGETQTELALTQWAAAWQRFGYSEPVVCSAYVSRFPTPAELEALHLREVPEAGNLWLFVPEDEGVFLETARPLRLPVVADAQIYIDLQNTGLRGPDAAQALRDWEGFCRP